MSNPTTHTRSGEPTHLPIGEGERLVTEEPGQVRRNHLAAAFVLCAVTGVISGVIAMAISVLATTVLSTPAGHFIGMDITAVVFVVFCVLGWFSSAVIVWARFKSPPAKIQDQRRRT